MSTIRIGNLSDKKSGAKFEDLGQFQGEGTVIERAFALIYGGGNGGNITLSATTSIPLGTSNSKLQSGEVLASSRFYWE